MVKRIDLSGQRFGLLTVICEAEPYYIIANGKKTPRRRWHCHCECGAETITHQDALRDGRSLSCGCRRKDITRAMKTIHGRSKTPEYRSWRKMKERCLDPKNNRFKYYGGRGITVCDEWRDSFEAFYRDMGQRPQGMTLDRIDTEGNYEPDNCRWATASEQAYSQWRARRARTDAASN